MRIDNPSPPALLGLCLFALACGSAPLPNPGRADGGLADGGDDEAIDAGCPAMELADGGCIGLSFARVCDVARFTVLQSGVLADDAAAQQIGQSMSACAPSPATSVVDTRNGGGGLLDANGRPLVSRDETFISAGGSFGQPFVRWYEGTGHSPVVDSSTATEASLSNAGSLIFSEPMANIGPSLDYFTLEFVRSTPNGPLSVIGYGFYGPGTAAAAWYFEHRIMTQRSASSASWYVVRWNDTDGDLKPGQADQFTLLRSGS